MNASAVSPHGRRARIPIAQPAVLFPAGEVQRLVGKAQNLSEGGVFVGGLDHKPDEGSRVRLSFALPNGVTIESDATVLRSVPSEHPCETSGVALRFDQLEQGCSEALQSFITDALLKPTDEEVKVKLATPKMVITTRARSLQDNMLILEQELPFLRLGSQVKLLRASGMRPQAGALRWVSMHVPPSGDFPRIVIGVDLGADSAEEGEAKTVVQPPPLPPDIAARSDPTINLDEQPELLYIEEESTGSTIDLEAEPGLFEEIKRPPSEASLYDLDFLDLVGGRFWLRRLLCALCVILIPGVFALVGYGLSRWILAEPRPELATSVAISPSLVETKATEYPAATPRARDKRDRGDKTEGRASTTEALAKPTKTVSRREKQAKPTKTVSRRKQQAKPTKTVSRRKQQARPTKTASRRKQAKPTKTTSRRKQARPTKTASRRKQAKPAGKRLDNRSRSTRLRRQRLAAARRAKKVKRHLRLANKALKRGKWRLARRHASRAQRLDPKNQQARRIIRKATRHRRSS